MSSRFFQLQTEAAHGARNSSPHRAHHSSRPQPQTSSNYSRSSTSSDSSSSSTSSSYSDQGPARYSVDSAPRPRVEVMRCSRCAKCVETITTSRDGRDGSDVRRVSTDDASASGMVRFGHNLYYCDRCAKMVGYK
jgi:hypothetical protein